MADIGNAPGRAFHACRRTVGVRRRRPGGPSRLGGAPAAIDRPTQQIAPAFRWRAARIEEALAIEMIGDGADVIARHGEVSHGLPYCSLSSVRGAIRGRE